MSSVSTRVRTDLPVVKEGSQLDPDSSSARSRSAVPRRAILPSVSAPEHNILALLDECDVSGSRGSAEWAWVGRPQHIVAKLCLAFASACFSSTCQAPRADLNTATLCLKKNRTTQQIFCLDCIYKYEWKHFGEDVSHLSKAVMVTETLGFVL